MTSSPESRISLPTPKVARTSTMGSAMDEREAKFVEDHVEKATREVDEWQYGSIPAAIEKARKMKFNDGRAPCCATSIKDISAMGAGIALHLELQRSGFVLMALLSILALPVMFICYSGERVPQNERDALYMAQLSLANVGVAEGSQLGNSSDSGKVDVVAFGEMGLQEQALVIALSDMVYSLVFLGFIFWFARRINQVVEETDSGNVTPADYAVLVRRLPHDATEREILEHFDKLYSLWDEDWTARGYCCGLIGGKGAQQRRPQFKPETDATLEEAQEAANENGDRFHIGALRRTTANPVTDPRNAPPRKRPMYTSKWVAEVSVAHPNGSLIRRFQRLKNLTRKLEDLVEEAAYYKHVGRTSAHTATVRKVEQLATKVFQTNAKSTDNLSVDCVGAFVLFENEESRRRCVYDASVYSGGCCGAPRPLRFRREHELEVTSAAEPSNVIWENFEVTDAERTRRKLAVNCVVLLLLLLSTAIVIFFQQSKQQAQEGVPDVSICNTELPISLYGSSPLVPSGWEFERDRGLEWPAAVERFKEENGGQAPTEDDYNNIARRRVANRVDDATTTANTNSNFTGPQCLEGSFHIRLAPVPLHRAWRVPLDKDGIPIYDSDEFDASALVNATDLISATYDAFDVPIDLRDAALANPNYDVNTTVHCLNPCVDVSDTTVCPTATGGKYLRNTIAGCYCIATFSNMIDAEGIQAAIDHIQNNEADLCLPFIEGYSLSQALAAGAAVLVVVINQALQVILTILTKYEKHNSVSDEQSALARKIFIGQLINTAFIILVVNANFRRVGSTEIPGVGELFAGQFDSFTPRWFVVVGTGLTLTMVSNIIIPHLSPLLQTFCLRPLLRLCHRRGITQSRVEQAHMPPEFLVAARYPVLLNNIFVTLLYCSGLPLLLPIASISFFVSYWVDKYLVLRIYARPRGTDATLAKLALSVMPWALIMHLAFAVYMYGDQELLRSQEVPFDQWFGPATQASIDNFFHPLEVSDPLNIVERLRLQTTAAFFITLILLVGVAILYYTAGRAILFLLHQILFVISCGRCGALSAEDEEFNPPFTGEFYQPVDDDDAAAVGMDGGGWALKPDPYRPGDHFMKVKLWTEMGENEGKYHDEGTEMSTWEVVKEATVHSYRMEWNPAYRDAVRVMDKTLRSLGIDIDAHDMSLPDAAVVADDRRGNVDLHAQIKHQDDVGDTTQMHGGALADEGALSSPEPRDAWGAGTIY